MDCYFPSTKQTNTRFKFWQHKLSISFRQFSLHKYFLYNLVTFHIFTYPVSKGHMTSSCVIGRHVTLITRPIRTSRHIVWCHTKWIHRRYGLHWRWGHTPWVTDSRGWWYRDNRWHFVCICARTVFMYRILWGIWFHWWKAWIYMQNSGIN
jgi:hypothetical protein